MAQSSKTTKSRINSPGPFVQALHINFEIPLEINFMPTTAEFQLLATACPNMEELQIPTNVFWSDILSIDTNRYWRKIKTISDTMNHTNIHKFMHFRSSLTYLPIHSSYQPRQQRLSDIIQQFASLETIQIMHKSSFMNHLYDMVPTLLQCPQISGLIMTSSGSPSNNISSQLVIPTLRYLNLTLTEVSPYLTLQAITKTFAYLNRLVLSFTPCHTESDDALIRTMKSFIRYNVHSLSQSNLSLFIHQYPVIHCIAKHFFMDSCIKPSLSISYSNCSPALTGQPSVSYDKDMTHSHVYIRYQNYLDHHVLPHLTFLKECGPYLHNASIQGPSALIKRPANHLTTLLTVDCPHITVLQLSQYHFNVVPSTLTSALTHLVLRRSLITSNAFSHLSKLCPSLQFLTLKDCCSEKDDSLQSIHMPLTQFKKLVVTDSRSKNYLLVINQTSRYYYCHTTQQLSKIPLVFEASDALMLNIQCQSIEMFIFNSIQVKV